MVSDDEDEDEIPTLIAASSLERKIPVTILTGFLGSGKTTLLNHLLTANHGKKIAIIENEFSAGLGIEGMIAKSGLNGENIDSFFELNNGCICCSVKDSLVTTLEQLVLHKDKFDYIIIETTGVANPGPIISTFWADDGLDTSLKLDGVVCIVDSLNAPIYLQANREEAEDVLLQISYADRILLNKMDLASEEALAKLEQDIRAINSFAEVRRTTFSNVGPDWVLEIDSYHSKKRLEDGLASLLALNSEYCSPCTEVPTNLSDMGLKSPGRAESRHSADVLTSQGFRFTGALNLTLVHQFLDSVLYKNGELAALHSKGDRGDATASRISAGAGAGAGAGAIATTVATVGDGGVGAEVEGSPSTMSKRMRGDDVNGSDKGADKGMVLYRMKGMVHVDSSPMLHVLQSVHDIFELLPSSYHRDSEANTMGDMNSIIAIGKNIDRDFLLRGFERCCLERRDDTLEGRGFHDSVSDFQSS